MTCAQAGSVEGADYASTYSVTANSFKNGVNLQLVTEGQRLYVMGSGDKYKMFSLKNREFIFTVDDSTLTCGLNGALYFVETDQRGDWDGHNNNAGAKFGTGYCEAQCPHDIKFMKGEANLLNWNYTNVPPVGHYGAC